MQVALNKISWLPASNKLFYIFKPYLYSTLHTQKDIFVTSANNFYSWKEKLCEGRDKNEALYIETLKQWCNNMCRWHPAHWKNNTCIKLHCSYFYHLSWISYQNKKTTLEQADSWEKEKKLLF